MLRRIVMLLLILGVWVMPVLAQDDPDPTPETYTAEEVQNLLDEMRLEVEAAAAYAEEAASAQDLAFNLLGIFEAVSVAITIVGAGLGVVGFGRLISAESSLTQAREEVQEEIKEIRSQFERDLEVGRKELQELSQQIVHIVEEQRKEAANATLATALLAFGERQYRAADYVGAATTYQRALELDNKNPVTFYRLGYVYTAQGDLNAAEDHLKESLAIDSAFAPSIVALGFVYRRKGEKLDEGIEREQMFNMAEKQMLEGLKASPKLVDEDGESWWGALGGLYRRRGQVDQAIYAYEQATIVTPHSSYPFGNLANLYGRENNIEAMLRMYKRVEKLAFAEVQAEVDNYWGYFDLLTAHLATNHIDKAEDILPSVLETVPADAVYALESLVDTLTRVAGVLKDYPQHADILRFVARIEAYIEERKSNPTGLPLGARPEDTLETFATPTDDTPPEDATPSS